MPRVGSTGKALAKLNDGRLNWMTYSKTLFRVGKFTSRRCESGAIATYGEF
jgi:hypothetical protein